MSIIIRQANITDAEAISQLITGMTHYVLADPASPEVRPFLETLTPYATAERIAASNFSYYLAESSGVLCGVIALRDDSHLYHLFVSPGMHRRGVARALWEHAKGQSGHSSFTVNSSLSAVHVYERLGFIAKSAAQSASGLVFVPMVYGHDS